MQRSPLARAECLESRTLLAVDVSVVMTGLDSPRGLDFAPNGALYVAEGGRGGGPGAPTLVNRGETLYYGTTGAISRLFHGEQERVVTGLPSLAAVNGVGGTGPSDVSFRGGGHAYVTIGLGGNPAVRAQLGDLGDGFARLLRVKLNGKSETVADIGTFEATANPDGRLPDSNPTSALAEGNAAVVVDAGGNSLLRVDKKGNVSTLAVFPRLPTPPVFSGDPVPTSVVVGPDGAYYVGILSGAPFVNGIANVYRVVPGEAPTVFRSGFKTVLDVDFDPAGNLYVLQHSAGPAGGLATPGSLIRVAPDGTRTTVIDGLNQPTSVAIGHDGSAYVSINGLSPGAGQVIRVTTTPDAALPVAAPGGAIETQAGAADILGLTDDAITG
jgi:sugar lactone lactonase YvrE